MGQDKAGSMATPNHTPSTKSEKEPRTPMSALLQRFTPTREWWEAIKRPKSSERLCGSSASQAALAQVKRVPFNLNIPEHLPNSPLCPRHPLFVGKGNGVCVYHGRKELFVGNKYNNALRVSSTS